MPSIGSVKRSATVAWGASSDYANLLAAGTVAGAISDSFDTSSQLEILSVDVTSSGAELPSLGMVQTSERFCKLAWGIQGIEDGSLPMGLIAGAMVDGSIKIYNPALMLACAVAHPPPDPPGPSRLAYPVALCAAGKKAQMHSWQASTSTQVLCEVWN